VDTILVFSNYSLFLDLVSWTLHAVSTIDTDQATSGPNTDLLGRRWFLVIGNLICFVGQIVIGVAKNASMVTAGMVVVGFGAANCRQPLSVLKTLAHICRSNGCFCGW
jgi:MFS family permease